MDRSEVPDWHAAQLTFGLVSGIFIQTGDKAAMQKTIEKIKKDLKTHVNYVDVEITNITKHFNLEKHSKDAFVAMVEFYDHEDAKKAKDWCDFIEVENEVQKTHFELKSESIDADDLLEHVPVEHTTYKSDAESNSTPPPNRDLSEESDSESGPDDQCGAYKIAVKDMKVAKGNRQMAKTFFCELFQLGCSNSCKTCQKPVKINKDMVVLYFPSEASTLETVQKFHGRQTKFGVLNLEVLNLTKDAAQRNPHGAASDVQRSLQMQLGEKDVAAFLPMSLYGKDDEKDISELGSISDKFKDVEGFVSQDIILPKSDGGPTTSEIDVILLSSYKDVSSAMRAVQVIKDDE